MAEDDVLTISEGAEFFKVSHKTVYALAQKGELPGFKVGGQWRFRRKAIDAWIDKRTLSVGLQSPKDLTAREGPS